MFVTLINLHLNQLSWVLHFNSPLDIYTIVGWDDKVTSKPKLISPTLNHSKHVNKCINKGMTKKILIYKSG